MYAWEKGGRGSKGGGNELSFTASQRAVEFSADMDIIPFALP